MRVSLHLTPSSVQRPAFDTPRANNQLLTSRQVLGGYLQYF